MRFSYFWPQITWLKSLLPKSSKLNDQCISVNVLVIIAPMNNVLESNSQTSDKFSVCLIIQQTIQWINHLLNNNK